MMCNSDARKRAEETGRVDTTEVVEGLTGEPTRGLLVRVAADVWLNPAAVAMVEHQYAAESYVVVTLMSGDTRPMPAGVTVDDVLTALGGAV